MSQLGASISLSSRLKQIERIAELVDQPSVSSSVASSSSDEISNSEAGQLLNLKT